MKWPSNSQDYDQVCNFTCLPRWWTTLQHVILYVSTSKRRGYSVHKKTLKVVTSAHEICWEIYKSAPKYFAVMSFKVFTTDNPLLACAGKKHMCMYSLTLISIMSLTPLQPTRSSNWMGSKFSWPNGVQYQRTLAKWVFVLSLIYTWIAFWTS